MKKNKSNRQSDDADRAAGRGGPCVGEERELGPILDDLPQELAEVAGWIRSMPDLEPPPSLLPSVMGALRAKQVPWWRRFHRWVISPRSLTFTPLQAALAGILLVALSTFSAFQLMKGGEPSGRLLLTQTRNGVPVAFSVHLPGARSVAVVGTFNEWRPQGYEMQIARNGDQTWTLALPLPHGRYEYAFLVDGKEIIPDPRAAFYQDDGFGNRNGVLIVGNENDKAI